MNSSPTRQAEDALDGALVLEARAGKLSAFAALFRRHSDRIYSLTRGMLRDDAAAQDAVQEAFVAAWRNLHTFREDASFRSWIARIATNAALMRLRTRRRHPEEPLELRAPGFQADGHFERQVADWTPLAEQVLENHELGVRVRQAVEDLPDKYRVVLVLADFEHRSMREIADDLELTVPAVKTRLHRARLAVRDALGDYLQGSV